jgi:hypothetical protein
MLTTTDPNSAAPSQPQQQPVHDQREQAEREDDQR